MSSIFTKNQNRLVYHFDAETLWVESWGKNSLRSANSGTRPRTKFWK